MVVSFSDVGNNRACATDASFEFRPFCVGMLSTKSMPSQEGILVIGDSTMMTGHAILASMHVDYLIYDVKYAFTYRRWGWLKKVFIPNVRMALRWHYNWWNDTRQRYE